MKSDQSKTKAELIRELQSLRKRGSDHDITECNQVGEFQSPLIKYSPTTMYLFDDKMNFIATNPAGEKLLGYTSTELCTMSIPQVDADPDAVKPAHDQLNRGEPIINYEHKLCRKDGRIITVLNNSVALKDSSGKVTHWYSFLLDITERNRLEGKLLSERDKFNSILQKLPFGVSVLDSEDKLVYINSITMKIEGYEDDPDSLIGKDLRSIHPKHTWATIDELLNDLKSGKKSYSTMEAKRGKHTVEVSYQVFRNTKGEYQGLIRLVSDITQRKQAEEKLREREEKYRLLTEYAQDFIWTCDLNYNFLFLNKVAPGLKLKDVIGNSVYNYIPEEFHESVEKCYENIQETGQPDQYFSHWTDNTGKTSYFEVEVGPIIKNGEIAGFVSRSHDITERKRAEEALREREQQLSQIYNSVGLVLFYIAVEADERFRFRSVNQVFLDATGLVEGQIVGKRIEEVIPEPAVSMVRDNYKKAIEEKRIIRWEETTEYPTGIKVGEVSIAPVFHNGICTYLVGSVHDLTERKQAEEELKKYQQRLEEKVDKRTAELKASNKELEAFAYSVSHDLRSPLRAINGFSQIIASRHRADLKEEGRHYFDNIVEASHHMEKLIEDLLKYSQLGRKTVDLVSTHLGGIWEVVMDTFSERIAETNAQIDLPADLPAVMGNRTLLIQTFTNLLDNALLYHKPKKPPQIKVKGQLDDGYVIISFSDKGIGIAPEYHGKIFDVFQRLHQQAEYPGTGIGLAIVKKAVALLKGALWVESALGKGSTFHVKLPLQNDD